MQQTLIYTTHVDDIKGLDSKRILIVAGPRNYHNESVIHTEINQMIRDYDILRVISGGATGVDSITRKYCLEQGIRFSEYMADWKKFGRAAGPIRNREMARNATHLLAFYNGSKGTSNMIKVAKELRLTIKIVNIDELEEL